MEFEFRAFGYRRAHAYLQGLRQVAYAAIRRGTRAVATAIAKQARQEARFQDRTGTLRRSIRSVGLSQEVEGPGGRLRRARIAARAKAFSRRAWYGRFVARHPEYGAWVHRAYEHLGRGTLDRIFADAFRPVFDREARKLNRRLGGGVRTF